MGTTHLMPRSLVVTEIPSRSEEMGKKVPVQKTGTAHDLLRFPLFPVTSVEPAFGYLDLKTEVPGTDPFLSVPILTLCFSCLFLLDSAHRKHWQKTFCPAGGPARIAGGHHCQFCPWGGGGDQPKSRLQIQWVWKIPFVYWGPGQSSQPVAVTLWSTGPCGKCSQQHRFRGQPGEGRVEVSGVWMEGSAICFFPGIPLSSLASLEAAEHSVNSVGTGF